MGGGFIQFFSDHLANHLLIQRLVARFKVLSESFVDHCLISVSRRVSSIAEFLDQIGIDVCGDSGLALTDCFAISTVSLTKRGSYA